MSKCRLKFNVLAFIRTMYKKLNNNKMLVNQNINIFCKVIVFFKLSGPLIMAKHMFFFKVSGPKWLPLMLFFKKVVKCLLTIYFIQFKCRWWIQMEKNLSTILICMWGKIVRNPDFKYVGGTRVRILEDPNTISYYEWSITHHQNMILCQDP